MKIEKKYFGSYQGQDVYEYLLTNESGVRVGFLTLGARINRWEVPSQIPGDPSRSIILGYETMDQVLEGRDYYYGATIGRVAGRLADARFSLDGETYTLPANDGKNSLHGGGGSESYDLSHWEAEVRPITNGAQVIFSHYDPDGSQGYPGAVSLQVIHEFTQDQAWTVSYQALVTQATPLNLTNHVYFNLNGRADQAITNHTLQVQADHYVPLRADSIPLGYYQPVDQTAFDLRQPRLLEEVLTASDEQVTLMQGLDHPFVFRESQVAGQSLAPQVTLVLDSVGRLEVTTDQAGVVLYSHNYLDPAMDIWQKPLVQHAGLAIETQAVPDSINQPQLGQTVLRPGEIYQSQTTYRFHFN